MVVYLYKGYGCDKNGEVQSILHFKSLCEVDLGGLNLFFSEFKINEWGKKLWILVMFEGIH